MENVQLQQILEGMQQRIQQQELQLQHVRSQHDQHQAQLCALASKKQGNEFDLHDDVQGAFPPHLQIEPMERDKRKLIVKSYPKATKSFPKPVKDNNGLAARAISSKDDKKWLLERLPAIQGDALDVLRIATSAWHSYLCTGSNEKLFEAIKDITSIAADNAQRLAQLQLKETFAASGAKGSYSIMDLSPDSTELDTTEHSLFQQAHIEALQDLKKFTKSVDTIKKPDKNGKHNSDKPRHNGRPNFSRGRGGHDDRNFGRGGGNWRPNFRSYGGGRGRQRDKHDQERKEQD